MDIKHRTEMKLANGITQFSAQEVAGLLNRIRILEKQVELLQQSQKVVKVNEGDQFLSV